MENKIIWGYRYGEYRTKFGYSYFETGCIFHDNQYDKEYGDEFSDGDVVEVYLDLKNQMALSFGINENKFAKAYNVDGEKIHKLAVSRYQGNLEIVSFKVTQWMLMDCMSFIVWVKRKLHLPRCRTQLSN